MSTITTLIVALSTLFSSVLAAPKNAKSTTTSSVNTCTKVKLASFTDAAATPFCSSFLSIPAVTTMLEAIKTPAVVVTTVANNTVTITAPTVTQTPIFTVVETAISTSFTRTCSPEYWGGTGKLKRDMQQPAILAARTKTKSTSSSIPTPWAYEGVASAKISQACNCLTIPTSTLTLQSTTLLNASTTAKTPTMTITSTPTSLDTATTLTTTSTSYTATTSLTYWSRAPNSLFEDVSTFYIVGALLPNTTSPLYTSPIQPLTSFDPAASTESPYTSLQSVARICEDWCTTTNTTCTMGNVHNIPYDYNTPGGWWNMPTRYYCEVFGEVVDMCAEVPNDEQRWEMSWFGKEAMGVGMWTGADPGEWGV